MSDEHQGKPPPSRRTDVGYKRPPIETRFKKGQKPPPRKKKAVQKERIADIFWRVLQEARPVRLDGKVQWIKTKELLVKMAFAEADRGSPVLTRVLTDLLLSMDEAAEPEVIPPFPD